MKSITYAKAAFEQECGFGVRFDAAEPANGEVRFKFTITGTGRKHAIGTSPVNFGRGAIEAAAKSAGRYARIMSERPMGGSDMGTPSQEAASPA